MKRQTPISEVDDLIERLGFTPESAVEAAVAQPGLYYRAAKYRVSKMHARVDAEARYESIEAAEDLRLRKQSKESGDKLTEKHFTNLVLTNAKVQEALRVLHEARVEEEVAKELLEAYKQRQYCLRTVSDLTDADRFLQAHATDKLEDVRSKLRKKYNED